MLNGPCHSVINIDNRLLRTAIRHCDVRAYFHPPQLCRSKKQSTLKNKMKIGSETAMMNSSARQSNIIL